jgi:hypothetical protein
MRTSSRRGPPDSPQGNAPAYRLAFADPDFLMRDELRPGAAAARASEARASDVGIRRGVDRRAFRRRPHPRSGAQGPRADPTLAASVAPLRGGAKARPDHDGALDRLGSPARRDRDRRRPRRDGGGKPGRGRGRGRVHRAQHRAAARATAERLCHAGPVLQLPLLRYSQDALPDAGPGSRGLPRRLRDARRAVRDADAGPDGPDAAVPSCCSARTSGGAS